MQIWNLRLFLHFSCLFQGSRKSAIGQRIIAILPYIRQHTPVIIVFRALPLENLEEIAPSAFAKYVCHFSSSAWV